MGTLSNKRLNHIQYTWNIAEVVDVRLLLTWVCTEFNPSTLNAMHSSCVLSIGVEIVDEV